MADNKDKSTSPESTPPKFRGRVLIIAGSDSGGGAGIQADIKTVTALGGYAATAITALTIQNTLGVSGVVATPPKAVRAQMEAVLRDIGADALKTGMLGDRLLVETLAEAFEDLAPKIPRIIDPVMIATSGDSLLPQNAIDAVRQLMIPNAALVTPNAPEAEVLTGKSVDGLNGQRRAAEKLLSMGANAALVKGGHVPGDLIVDVLATQSGEHFFEGERIHTKATHGTGCTLASGIAVGIARGLSMTDAVALARAYLVEAIKRAPGLGQGNGPVDHGWPSRDPEAFANLFAKYKPA
ncbi:MAG TPA: bifunctional hydroxymethylpyrimidine kinase/phosphomethylpyrimidine kinase [Hyphomonadaceae bacterium]|jgi:hydroxymethylpyrimidine/phosphomethylpyrimidine kinase|nr:bifunctional hydroxymethylpyrimidine kinase/phosphomethylpyrimidine kinase [Hyphomonadaceae bacterium]